MTSITHSVVTAKANNPAYDVSANAWNASHVITGTFEYFIGASDPNASIGQHPVVNLVDGVTTTVYTYLLVPLSFASIIAAEVLIIPGATGNMRRSVDTTWGAIGTEAYNANTDSVAAGEVTVTINRIEAIDITAALTGIAAGDLVGINFTRIGDHANDTVNASCYFVGVRLRYQQ